MVSIRLPLILSLENFILIVAPIKTDRINRSNILRT